MGHETPKSTKNRSSNGSKTPQVPKPFALNPKTRYTPSPKPFAQAPQSPLLRRLPTTPLGQESLVREDVRMLSFSTLVKAGPNLRV